ncbi:MAG: PAS domain S-box protein [Chthoniobacterales bacterium]|nr:PAS domain S-box protein [Chthoniobacterales bacterium]
MTSAEEDFYRIFLRLDEGVLLLRANGEIDLANEAFMRWFGLTNEVVRQPFGSVLGEAAINELAAAVWREETPAPREILVQQEGVKRWLIVRASRLGAGEGARAVLLFQDVTAQRTLEEVGIDFVANVSHELRTPVSILTGYIENLADFPKMPRSEQVEIFGIMQEHALRLKALLNDLLTLACFESRSDVLDLAELDLRQFLRQLAKDWQPSLASKEMAFVLEIDDGVSTIRVDRFRFEQVMHNLFDNAFKYTPLEGQIRVRVAGFADHVEISVEDNGAGIPEADLPHIFERFYRVDKARSRRYGGTGLGLSIVKHIVTLHGGTVRAESTLQMSTRIIISLPRA